MDIREQLKQAKTPEEMKQYLLDLDSEFRFKCRRCGKCCKNQDTILFTPRDIFNIAKKLGAAPRQVIDLCAEVYIGRSSRIPLVHMCPSGRRGAARCCWTTADAAFTTASLRSVRFSPWDVLVSLMGSRIQIQRLPGRI